jgi:hypothetical protein
MEARASAVASRGSHPTSRYRRPGDVTPVFRRAPWQRHCSRGWLARSSAISGIRISVCRRRRRRRRWCASAAASDAHRPTLQCDNRGRQLLADPVTRACLRVPLTVARTSADVVMRRGLSAHKQVLVTAKTNLNSTKKQSDIVKCVSCSRAQNIK